MNDDDLETLIAEIAADGIVVTKEEAYRAVHHLAELLVLISRPLPLPPPSYGLADLNPEALPPEPDAPPREHF